MSRESSHESLRHAWEALADDWAAWVRGGNDIPYAFHAPRFLELVPEPGRLTIDLGCGEGRMTAELARLGHTVVGVDSSPAMLRLARTAHPELELVEADALALPFDDASADLVVAFMSLINMDDLDGAVAEAARALEPGGRFSVAVLHPIAAAGSWNEDATAFVVDEPYLEAGPWRKTAEREGGVAFTFDDIRRPLQDYTLALERAGFELEAVREPIPGPELLDEFPAFARWTRVPLFLDLRAVKA